MLDVLPNPDTSARQVELAVARLDSLSTLPCVGVQLLSRLQQGQLSPAALAEIIQSDPALAAKWEELFPCLGRWINYLRRKFEMPFCLWKRSGLSSPTIMPADLPRH
jgi:hypothetical protein